MLVAGTVARVQDFDVGASAAHLSGKGGGYEVVHTSPGLEIGVYVLRTRRRVQPTRTCGRSQNTWTGVPTSTKRYTRSASPAGRRTQP